MTQCLHHGDLLLYDTESGLSSRENDCYTMEHDLLDLEIYTICHVQQLHQKLDLTPLPLTSYLANTYTLRWQLSYISDPKL